MFAVFFFVYLCTFGLNHYAEEEGVRGRKEGRKQEESFANK